MRIWFCTFLFFGLILSSCDEVNKKQPPAKKVDVVRIKNQFVKANQQLIKKENDEMDYYEKTHQQKFVRTSSGVRYFVYKPSVLGDSLKEGMQVTLDYVVKLLSGEECYNSKTEGQKTIRIEQEQIESGIHRGLQYIKRGDKVQFLIPSHLAHGLLGDMNKIPPQVPILYDVTAN